MFLARRNTFTHLTLASLALTAALTAGACADANPAAPTTGPATGTSSSSNDTASVVGTYQLAAVDGQTVPCVFDSFSPGPGYLMQMRAVDGSIRLNTDGTYREEYQTELSGSGSIHGIVNGVLATGHYTVAGNTITLTPNSGGSLHATYSVSDISIVVEAPGLNGQPDRATFTFRR